MLCLRLQVFASVKSMWIKNEETTTNQMHGIGNEYITHRDCLIFFCSSVRLSNVKWKKVKTSCAFIAAGAVIIAVAAVTAIRWKFLISLVLTFLFPPSVDFCLAFIKCQQKKGQKQQQRIDCMKSTVLLQNNNRNQ